MTRLYRLAGDALEPVAPGRLANENLIEGWLERQPDLLGLDILLVGRQVVTEFGGRIDLLGIDADGNLVIVELKRDRTPREIIAQVLDYASWVAGLTTRQVHDLAASYLKEQLDIAFRGRFGNALPQTLNETHTMVIVASGLMPLHSASSAICPRSTTSRSTPLSSRSSRTKDARSLRRTGCWIRRRSSSGRKRGFRHLGRVCGMSTSARANTGLGRTCASSASWRLVGAEVLGPLAATSGW